MIKVMIKTVIKKQHTVNADTYDIRQPLLKLGWESHFQNHLDNISDDNVFPARIVGGT